MTGEWGGETGERGGETGGKIMFDKSTYYRKKQMVVIKYRMFISKLHRVHLKVNFIFCQAQLKHVSLNSNFSSHPPF